MMTKQELIEFLEPFSLNIKIDIDPVYAISNNGVGRIKNRRKDVEITNMGKRRKLIGGYQPIKTSNNVGNPPKHP